jgi:membrane-associated protein
MIPGMDLIDFISWASLVGVALVVFAESGLLIGFFLPGDSLLLTTGLLVSRGLVDYSIHVVVIVLFIAAVLGDNTGYWFGKKMGRSLFKKKDTPIFHKENLIKAEKFYQRHGNKTIVIARFVPFARTFAPILAGISHMHYRTFFIYNIIGALLWAAGLTYLGYFAGSWLEKQGIDIDKYLILIIFGVILLSLLPAIYHSFQARRSKTS